MNNTIRNKMRMDMIHFILGCICLVGCASSCRIDSRRSGGGIETQRSHRPSSYDEARKEYRCKNYTKAVALYEKMAEELGGSFLSGERRILAQMYSDQARYRLALEIRSPEPSDENLSETVGIRKYRFEDSLWRSNLYRMLGEYDQSYEVLGIAREITNEAEEWVIEETSDRAAHFGAEVDLNSVSLLERASRTESQHRLSLRIAEARILLDRGYYEEVIELLKSYLEANSAAYPKSQEAWILSGVAHYHIGNVEVANKVLSTRIDKLGRGEDLRWALAAMWRTLDSAAIRRVTGASRFSHNDLFKVLIDGCQGEENRIQLADVYLEKGLCLLHKGDWAGAGEAFDQSIILRKATATETHPNCADSLVGKAAVLATRGQYTEALVFAQNALEILDASLVDTHPRGASVLQAIIQLEHMSKSSVRSEDMQMRLEALYSRPLGVWESDYALVRDFFAEVNSK